MRLTLREHLLKDAEPRAEGHFCPSQRQAHEAIPVITHSPLLLTASFSLSHYAIFDFCHPNYPSSSSYFCHCRNQNPQISIVMARNRFVPFILLLFSIYFILLRCYSSFYVSVLPSIVYILYFGHVWCIYVFVLCILSLYKPPPSSFSRGNAVKIFPKSLFPQFLCFGRD